MKTTLLCLATILAFSSCKKGEDNTSEQPCPIDVLCTMEFRAVTVSVKQNGVPLALDSYKTVKLSTGQEYNLQPTPGSWEDSSRKASGTYPVLTDGQKEAASRTGTLFEFRGYKNGALVAKQQYTISQDCCHISLVSGKTEISE